MNKQTKKMLNAMLDAMVGVYVALGVYIFYCILRYGYFGAYEPNPIVLWIEFNLTLVIFIIWIIRWYILYSD